MITPSFIELDRSIRQYVKQAINVEHVIQGNTNSPAPTNQYATALMLSNHKHGSSCYQPIYDPLTDTYTINVTSNHHIIYRIQIYRNDDPLMLARTLADYSALEEAQGFLNKNNLILLDQSEVNMIDSLQDSAFEKRASIDLTFGYISTLRQVVNSLDRIDIVVKEQSAGIIQDHITIKENINVITTE